MDYISSHAETQKRRTREIIAKKPGLSRDKYSKIKRLVQKASAPVEVHGRVGQFNYQILE